MKLAQLKSVLFSNSSNRSHERYRRAFLTTSSSIVAKGSLILTTLVVVPLTLHYLGLERYGLWMTISSVVALLGFADLGIGNGLVNAVSEATGRQDERAIQRYFTSAFLMLLAIVSLLGILFALAFRWISWKAVFNLSSPQAIAEAGPGMAVLVSCVLLRIALSPVEKTQIGFQEGFVNSLWEAGGNVLGLVGVLVAIRLRGGLPWLVLAMAGAPAVTIFMNGCVLVGWKRRWLRPSLAHLDGDAAQKVLQTGLLFFLLQLAVTVAFTSDNIIVAQILGPEAVAQYAVPMRIITALILVTGIFVGPLWPAYGEAVARHEFSWAKRALVRSLALAALLCGIPAIGFVFFGKWALQLWAGPQIQPTRLLLLGMAAWALVGGVGQALGTFLNGINVIRFQVVCAVLMASSSLGLRIALAHSIGLPGIIWGLVIAYIVFTAIPLSFHIARLIAGWERKAASSPLEAVTAKASSIV